MVGVPTAAAMCAGPVELAMQTALRAHKAKSSPTVRRPVRFQAFWFIAAAIASTRGRSASVPVSTTAYPAVQSISPSRAYQDEEAVSALPLLPECRMASGLPLATSAFVSRASTLLASPSATGHVV